MTIHSTKYRIIIYLYSTLLSSISYTVLICMFIAKLILPSVNHH
jgi:hypothetical protein